MHWVGGHLRASFELSDIFAKKIVAHVVVSETLESNKG